MKVEPDGTHVSGLDRPPVCILLAGGRGSRLYELTEAVCKPAVPFGPENRIVDFTLDNIRRSDLSQVIVASQYCAASLEGYLDRVWRPVFGAGLRLRRAATSARPLRQYDGTADAVWKNSVEIDAIAPREVIVLSADHIYAMDYRPMISAHRASGAAATIAADIVPADQASEFGCIEAQASGLITGFVEKPANPPRIQDRTGHSLVSMGIYVIDWAWLRAALAEDAANPESGHDFGHDILPRAVATGQAQVHHTEAVDDRPFFWRDVGTLDAFRATWLMFAGDLPPFDLPVLHKKPAISRVQRTTLEDCSILPLAEARLQASKGVLHGSVLMPGARVSEGSLLRNTIVSSGTRVPPGLVVGEDPEDDGRWFRVTPSGTTLITAEMLARRELQRPRPLMIGNHTMSSRSI